MSIFGFGNTKRIEDLERVVRELRKQASFVIEGTGLRRPYPGCQDIDRITSQSVLLAVVDRLGLEFEEAHGPRIIPPQRAEVPA